jgi:glycosyltransferase involved in cell wall biosynthesis
MKILHITPSYPPAWHLGGVVRSVSQLCRRLARLGHEVTVFTTDSGQDRRMGVPTDQPLDLEGVKVNYFKTDWFLKFCYSMALGKACRRYLREFDLVHMTSFWCYPGVSGPREARRWQVPYVVSTRGTFVPYPMGQKAWKKQLYFKWVEQRNLQYAAAIHYTAELEREEMSYLGLTRPSFIVPNGLDLGEFSQLPDKLSARKKLKLPPETPVVLFLGRLHARKGLTWLLEAFARLLKELPEALLILAGPDAGELSKLKQMVRLKGISSQVSFPGYIPPEKRNIYLRAADVFVLATHSGENFGNAAVEAMLAGVPVLLSEHVGICREVQADGAGMVVPLEVGAIAGALEQMLSDNEGLRTMGEKAAAWARRRYDIDLVARQMANAYEDILTGRRSPGLAWSDSQ